jgi:hypothetical protein
VTRKVTSYDGNEVHDTHEEVISCDGITVEDQIGLNLMQ